MSDKYEKETVTRIHGDDGVHWEIGEDSDGLQLVEIREISGRGKDRNIDTRLTMERELAEMIGEALLEYCQDNSNFQK